MSWDHNLENDTLAHTELELHSSKEDHHETLSWNSTLEATSPCAGALWHSAGGHASKHLLSAWTAPPACIVLSGCADMGFYHRVFSGDQIFCSSRQRGCCALHKAYYSKEKFWRACKVDRCLNMEAGQYLCTDTNLSVNLSLGKEEATTTCY